MTKFYSLNPMNLEAPEEGFLYSRSGTVIDWKCPRLHYYEYRFDGKGIVPDANPLELYLGTTIHDGLAVMADHHLNNGGQVDIDLIASTAREQVIAALAVDLGEPEILSDDDTNFNFEQAALVEGLLRGFYKHMWPRLLERFPKIIAIEQELTYSHNGLTFMARPDLILEDREGEIWYIEFKSTSSKDARWINSWQTAIQLHSTCRAIEATLGRKPAGVIVQGLYKSYVSYGKQSSPFCYAYRKEGNPPFSATVLQYDYKAGLKKYPTWLLEGGTKAWVEGMSEPMLADQFPQSPPIFIKDHLVESFFKQREVRESEIHMALSMMEGADEETKAAILDTSFPQHFSECTPAYGKGCAYRKICFGECKDPLSSGFSYRTPHHSLELDALSGD